MDYPNYFVVLLGLGTVFVGLIVIIMICKAIGFFCNISKKESKEDLSGKSNQTDNIPEKVQIPNHRETVAAIAAAIAEDTGNEISAIRILSIEKL